MKAEIVRLGCEDLLASGAVITGGTTQLPGMTELGEEILGIPVRRGVPKGVGGLAEVVRNADLLDGGRPRAVRRLEAAGDRPSTDAPKRGGLFSRLRRTLSSAF